tara:strand:- start:163 stop:399 length:237 start_codon:yes stop_codon:yes gene_type:complete
MTPNFNDNDLVLVFKFLNISINDVVVLDIPDFGFAIKRILLLDNEDIKVIGDNKEYKSPIYNMTLNRKNIVGKVVYKF